MSLDQAEHFLTQITQAPRLGVAAPVPSEDLVVMEVGVRAGVVGQGGALPALPASMRALWKESSANQVKGVRLGVAGEQARSVDRPLSGGARIDLEVLPSRGDR